MMIRTFDFSTIPLEGTHLIEASAGTGKTYTITGLFLKLIVETGLLVDQILVVTFTEAATAELKDRIRNKLREAVEAFANGVSEDHLLSLLLSQNTDPEEAHRRLKDAIRDFDQAAIFTIHGFCKRMLDVYAFESGTLFDTELVTEQDHLKREIVEDFWRKHIYQASPLFVRFCVEQAKISPTVLMELVGRSIAQPNLTIIPDIEPLDTALIEAQFIENFDRLRCAWRSCRDDVRTLLLNTRALNERKYGKMASQSCISGLDRLVSSAVYSLSGLEPIQKLASSEIQQWTLKGYQTPKHPFFELCEALNQTVVFLCRAFDQRVIQLKYRLFQYMTHELARRKMETNIQFFDDLLINLQRALHDEQGSLLAENIRKRFKAALIDEFQDTDPIQYDIFSGIFNNEQSVLFLIGDPKQAIYGFRGADIFAYINAKKEIESQFTIKENFRSEPTLVAAVNTVFSKSDRAFIYEEIPFYPVESPEKKHAFPHLTLDGKSEAPLNIWFLNPIKGNESAKLYKGVIKNRITKAIAIEIANLISPDRTPRWVIGDKPLEAGDIAVLVRTNMEARQVRQSLLDYNIPAVLYNAGNLFDTREATETWRILKAIAQPGNETSLKSALSMDILGVKGEEIAMFSENETLWENRILAFQNYHEQWRKFGFIRMFKSMILHENILLRLMAMPDGERRCTNLLHLMEVLHNASVEKKFDMLGTVHWLSERMYFKTHESEEHQLRLETDEHAVKIVTIHKSKGLEYPVVFLPFVYDNSKPKKNNPIIFHDENDRRRLTLDLGSDQLDKHRMILRKELLAENLRLLYVGLTRAKNRCYMAWGRINDSEFSAPAYLFHMPKYEPDIIHATGENYQKLTVSNIYNDLEQLRQPSENAIHISPLPAEGKPVRTEYSWNTDDLDCRKLYSAIDPTFRVASFSSLLSRHIPHTELADHDLGAKWHNLLELKGKKDFQNIFMFPGGTQAGTFFHDIFEHIDFTKPSDADVETRVTEKLKEYHFEPEWHETVCQMLRNVLTIPLEPERPDFTLSAIHNSDRLTELEFYFPLKTLSPHSLKSAFHEIEYPDIPKDFPEHIERLTFSTSRGFMKGFIDLVFRFEGKYYLIDWKSNLLGITIDDYHEHALPPVMSRDFYVLQYLIYTVALHQYLTHRLPDYSYETHFGGVYYLFIRGMNAHKGSEFGIYRARPSEGTIGILKDAIISDR